MNRIVLSRRGFLVGTGLAVAVLNSPGITWAGPRVDTPSGPANDSGDLYAYVGCYTTAKRNGHGRGISAFRVSTNGSWEPLQVLPTFANPSYLIADSAGRTLYSAHGDGGVVSSFGIDPTTGLLTELGRQNTNGSNVVHLALSPDERYLVAANYATGSVVVFPRRTDGALDPHIQLLQLSGTPGPLHEDQKGPQPHEVRFDPTGRHIVVPDKGTDRLHRLSFDSASGRLSLVGPPTITVAGTGPRHLDYHPDLALLYLVDELSSQLAVYDYDQDTATPVLIQAVSTVPADFTGDSTAAEIALSRDARYVYVSNRGHDSVACFGITPAGTVMPPSFTASGGRQPRFMAFDPAGEVLYVANQGSDTIVPFTQDTVSGQLTPTGQVISSGTPSSIAFVQPM